jgi:hypothetical protein
MCASLTKRVSDPLIQAKVQAVNLIWGKVVESGGSSPWRFFA